MQKKLKPYLIGFGFSIILTIIAFYFAWAHINSSHGVYSHDFIIKLVLGLALVQFIVQLFFFLGSELRQKWNMVMILSTVGLVFIVVVGSVWIMNHLNNNMTPQQVNQYVTSQDGF